MFLYVVLEIMKKMIIASMISICLLNYSHICNTIFDVLYIMLEPITMVVVAGCF